MKMKNIIKILLVLCFTLFPLTNLQAHKDRIITIKGGKLVGLPDEYQPSHFDLAKYTLRIKNHEMVFSPFLKSLFPEDGKYDLLISSSWYHDSSKLPPYIVFHIKPHERDYSHKIIINMDSLDVIKVSVVIKESDRLTRLLHIDISGKLKKDIEKSIKVVK